jgi:hypothetical protein
VTELGGRGADKPVLDIHIYIHIHVCTHTHTYTHIYIQVLVGPNLQARVQTSLFWTMVRARGYF